VNEETKAAILDELVDDGDTFKFDDGRWLRLKIEYDQDSSIRDADCWGEVSEYSYDYWRDGKTPRPDGFDGNAEKLQIGRGDWIWWQPPRGEMAWIDPETGKVARRGSEAFRKARQDVIDLLTYGFIGIIVELWHECPSCASKHEANSASLWGIEAMVDDGYKREVISDLLEELEV
jgi:hypothetical protein